MFFAGASTILANIEIEVLTEVLAAGRGHNVSQDISSYFFRVSALIDGRQADRYSLQGMILSPPTFSSLHPAMYED